jgi:cytochrome c5
MKTKIYWFLAPVSPVAIAITALLIVGCSTTGSSKSGTTDAGKPAGPSAQPTQVAQAGGAELWGRNCGHCHNIRSPSSYSDAQWEVVMMHMRVRANLTAEEHQKILAFLKSAH